MQRARFMPRLTAFRLLVLIFLCACMSSLYAQISSVRIYTKPAGATFYVDEQPYTGEVTLLWPANSKHFIRPITVQDGIQLKTRHTYISSMTNLGAPDSIWPITTNPRLTFVELDFSTEYAVTLSYYPCSVPDPLGCTAPRFPLPGEPFPPLPPNPPSPGMV